MKTKISATILLLLICNYSCKKDDPKIKGCTDPNSLTYSATAQEDNGSCTYLSGNYVCHETSSVGTDDYTIAIVGNTSFTINNSANQFDGITGTRSGLNITFNPKFNIADRSGKVWDFDGGDGTINSAGKVISYTCVIDDILHLNQIGTLSLSATGNKN